MLRIRRFEERIGKEVLAGKVRTPCHLCIGQEAIAVGVCFRLRPQDHVYGNHRSHGHYLAKGGDMKALAAEIFGKKTGCSKGRGGSMHLIAPEIGFMGSVPIVGATVGIATGDAWAAKLKGEDRVVVSFFGDGALYEGLVYESMTIAMLYDLPIIYVVENNGYATHMPTPPVKLELTLKCDGNDLADVIETVEVALPRLPQFIEAKTYRLCGHVGPDDNLDGEHTEIRPAEEIEEAKKHDPLREYGKYVERFEEIEIMDQINEAIYYAKESPYPDPKDWGKYTYA